MPPIRVKSPSWAIAELPAQTLDLREPGQYVFF
jgi:hypothetical protein